MKTKWTESSALNYLSSHNDVVINGKNITYKNGLNGLKSCSAVDYLRNICKYI